MNEKKLPEGIDEKGVYHPSTAEHDWSARDGSCACEECRRERSLSDRELNECDYPDDEK